MRAAPGPGPHLRLSDVGRSWPFWAPSALDAVDAALDIAGVGPGTRLVDLGCGDGQVLARAAERGATVRGIESDPDLADQAREQLTEAGVDAEIVTGDLLDPDVDLDADVLFTYLAPATLQRLLPRLRALPGRTLVTVDFDVPGLVPDRRHEPARRYRLPGRPARIGAPGWGSAGTLVATVPDVESLTCLDTVHPAGPTTVRASAALTAAATVFAGADHLPGPGALAVDLRWHGGPLGTVAGGSISTAGLGSHAVFVVHTDEEESVWELDAGAVARVRGALRRRERPTTLAEVLAVADGEA